MEELLIFAFVNLVTSVLSGAAGGGGGLVTAPLMIFLGLSPATAIATNKFSGLGISIGTSTRFYREKMTDQKTVIIFSLLGAFGAIVGSLLLVRFSDQQSFLETLIGLAILLVGIPMLYARNLGLKATKRSRYIKFIGLILLIMGVVLQAAVGSGMASLQMIIIMAFFGMPALVASATRRIMDFVVSIIGLTIFAFAGLINYRFGIIAFITALIGGYLGAHLAVKKGNKFVVNILAVTSAILALYLIFR